MFWLKFTSCSLASSARLLSLPFHPHLYWQQVPCRHCPRLLLSVPMVALTPTCVQMAPALPGMSPAGCTPPDAAQRPWPIKRSHAPTPRMPCACCTDISTWYCHLCRVPGPGSCVERLHPGYYHVSRTPPVSDPTGHSVNDASWMDLSTQSSVQNLLT